ncbi:hypothetical protein M1L60_16320 [Actinoplanes sp. TRM 88003]|uniref:Uncharacterized protein n=1 Tax=Paractinoplanes aksuensis TaxID=2939490 RepID=A0ABT1DMY1_9ACTN|nr:hypothetical protein [Actinoplanes aksuensis]MCO8272160.1 hypothetical protein [Actinoplanes aksuensis]
MNDEEYGHRLLQPLRQEPAGPPAIDVARAMREGHRRRSRRWWAASSAVALLATGLTGGLLVADRDEPRPDRILPAGCTVAALPTGSHKGAHASGIDATGAWIVGSTDFVGEPGPSSILVWHNGALVTDVKAPNRRKGTGGMRMADINASGVAVGTNNDGWSEPYVVEGGRFRKLAGGAGDANAINDAGVIVGTVGPSERPPVRWASSDAEPEPLPLPDDYRGSFSTAIDIAADGTIVGTINLRPYLWWPDGTHGYLEPLPIPGRRKYEFEPSAIRNGWVYGKVWSSESRRESDPPLPGDSTAFRYELRTRTWQVAGAVLKSSPPGTTETTTYANGTVLSLPSYQFPAPVGPVQSMVRSISDDARTVTGTTADTGREGVMPQAMPVIWRC